MKHSLFQPGTNTFAEAEGITNRKFAVITQRLLY